MLRNVTDFFANQLPPLSPNRGPIIKALSQGLSSTDAAQVFACAPSTVRACKTKDYSHHPLTTDKYDTQV